MRIQTLTAGFILLGAAIAAAQEPPKIDELAALKERVRQLESEKTTLLAENARIKVEMDKLRQFSMDAAEQLSRLRHTLSEVIAKATASAGSPEAGKPSAATGLPPVRCRVLVVVAEYGFLIIDKGEIEGLKEGCVFDIMRRIPDKLNGDRYELLGEAEFEKFVTATKNRQTKLKLTKGIADKMKYDDIAVLRRPGDSRPIEAIPADPAAKTDKIQIIGKVKVNDDKTGITLEIGTAQGVKVGMQFEVRRQGRPIGSIIIKEASKYTSRGEPLGTLKREEVTEGDFVESMD